MRLIVNIRAVGFVYGFFECLKAGLVYDFLSSETTAEVAPVLWEPIMKGLNIDHATPQTAVRRHAEFTARCNGNIRSYHRQLRLAALCTASLVRRFKLFYHYSGRLVMDYQVYPRDGYDLQYDRALPHKYYSPRGGTEEQPNDTDILAITNLENALADLVYSRVFSLNKESKSLKIELDEARFLFERLKALNPSSILNIAPDILVEKDFVPRHDNFNERNFLHARKLEAQRLRDVLHSKLKTFLAAKEQSFQGKMGEHGDTLLYRVQVKVSTPATSSTPMRKSNKPSGCRLYPLGYRCSGWDTFQEITNEEILNHMNGVVAPTSLISVQESPARLMVFLKKAIMNRDEEFTSVEVISLRMLQHIGILHVRSTDLCDGRGIPTSYDKKEGHAQYVTDTHWVIMDWIPDEAIMRGMSVASFLALCKEKEVIDGK